MIVAARGLLSLAAAASGLGRRPTAECPLARSLAPWGGVGLGRKGRRALLEVRAPPPRRRGFALGEESATTATTDEERGRRRGGGAWEKRRGTTATSPGFFPHQHHHTVSTHTQTHTLEEKRAKQLRRWATELKFLSWKSYQLLWKSIRRALADGRGGGQNLIVQQGELRLCGLDLPQVALPAVAYPDIFGGGLLEFEGGGAETSSKTRRAKQRGKYLLKTDCLSVSPANSHWPER